MTCGFSASVAKAACNKRFFVRAEIVQYFTEGLRRRSKLKRHKRRSHGSQIGDCLIHFVGIINFISIATGFWGFGV